MTDKKTEIKPLTKLLDSAARIKQAIDSIASRGARLDRDIWVAAASAIKHHVDHGDVTLINRLVDAMPKGSRVNALRAYFDELSAARYDEEAKAFVHVKGASAKLDTALSTPWYSFKPEAAYVPLDPAAILSNVIRKMQKDRDELGDASAVPANLIAGLEALKAGQIERGIAH